MVVHEAVEDTYSADLEQKKPLAAKRALCSQKQTIAICCKLLKNFLNLFRVFLSTVLVLVQMLVGGK